ncbi:MAG: FMN-binding negative transcriptional regulator [Bacteroidetes bacterium]|nr:FMN-binding negative transcriptional regulator [Bacteroidota bacterium]
MYSIPEFTVTDQQRIIEFIKANPFAIITANNPGSFPETTQVPLHVFTKEDDIYFTGHIMSKTGHHKAFEADKNVLVTFPGIQCYISASWYKKPNVASTWNYMTVFACGELEFLNDTETIKELKRITDVYEKDSEASFHKLPQDYVIHMARAVIAFKIKVNKFHAIFKLSQNHSDETRINIIRNLRERKEGNDLLMAEEMEKELNSKK